MIKRVSLKDIAEELNLTANTVSRALHDKDDISQKTKNQVKETAEKMGYIPDMVASSMRTSSTKTIAVLFDNLLNPYFAIMANHIHSHLNDKGYRMMIFTNISTGAILTMDILKQMIAHRVDGVISFLRPNQTVADFANKSHLPIFVIGREADDLNIDSIFTDDIGGGYKMGNYLFSQGYQKPGYIGGPENIKCNVKRAQGFNEFYNSKGINPILLYSTWDESSIYLNIDQLIENDVDSIFCFNDAIAYSAILYIRKKFPDKTSVKVTGYDNIASHLNLPIPLTTIGTDVEGMVSICVNQLIKKIDNFKIPLFIDAMPTFIVK